MISAYTKRIDDLAVKLKKYEKLFEDFETATMVGGINKHGNIVYYNQKTLQRKIDSVRKKMVTSAKQMEKELQRLTHLVECLDTHGYARDSQIDG